MLGDSVHSRRCGTLNATTLCVPDPPAMAKASITRTQITVDGRTYSGLETGTGAESKAPVRLGRRVVPA